MKMHPDQQGKPAWCDPNVENGFYETSGDCVVQSGKVVNGSCLVLTGSDCTIKNGSLVGGQCFAVTSEQGTLLGVLILIVAAIGVFSFMRVRYKSLSSGEKPMVPTSDRRPGNNVSDPGQGIGPWSPQSLKGNPKFGCPSSANPARPNQTAPQPHHSRPGDTRAPSMFGLLKKKPPTMLDALIHTIYGPNPSSKSADLERSITITHEDLLFECVPLSEVKCEASALSKGPIPYSTHDLAVSTALGFFKNPQYVPALQKYQIHARLRVVNWAKDGKVVKPLALGFEEVYKLYKPQPSEARERPMKSQEAQRKAQDVPTVKDLLIAREPPWNRVAPVVIKAVLDAITDKGLLEAFVMHSMDNGLVARYETLGGVSDPTIIRTQLSQILCETGNRAIPALAKARAAKQMEAAMKAMMLARDTFEAAITLAENQIGGYAGLAAIYGLVGKTAEADKYARLGLSELAKMRRTPAGRALRDSTIFPPDFYDQTERHLRTFLANK